MSDYVSEKSMPRTTHTWQKKGLKEKCGSCFFKTLTF